MGPRPKSYTAQWTYDDERWCMRAVDSLMELPEDFWLAPLRRISFNRHLTREQILGEIEQVRDT